MTEQELEALEARYENHVASCFCLTFHGVPFACTCATQDIYTLKEAKATADFSYWRQAEKRAKRPGHKRAVAKFVKATKGTT